MVSISRSLMVVMVVALIGAPGLVRADENQTVTLNFREATLGEVTAFISEYAGINIIAHKDILSERVSLSIKEKPVQAALQALALANDLTLETISEGVYMLRKSDGRNSSTVVRVGGSSGSSGASVTGPAAPSARPEVVVVNPPAGGPPVTAPVAARTELRSPHTDAGLSSGTSGGGGAKQMRTLIPLRYAKPSDIASFFGCDGLQQTLNGETRRFSPLRDTPGTGRVNLGDTINWNNRSTRQKQRLTYDPRKFYNAMYARDQFGDAAGAGGAGGPGGGARPGGGGPGGGAGGRGGQQVFQLPASITTLVGYDLISALIVVGEPDGIQELRELVELLDVAPQQIEVEARFVTLSVSDADSLGIVWSLTNNTASATASTPSGGGASLAFQVATGNFQTLLTSIVRNNKGKIVNAPKVATQNGQPALVEFDQEIPVTISDTVITQASQTVSPGIDFIDVTTSLYVVPRVTGQPPDESITTLITPQVGDVVGFVDNPSGGTIPITATQNIQALLRVRNGETIALGGLVRKNNSNSTTKVPLLGELPFIGSMFRSRTHNVDESELLIFMTPTILRELRAGAGATGAVR